MPALKRTVSIPVSVVCTILSLVFISACADKIKTNIIVFAALDEGLRNSNNAIDKSSLTIYASLEQKTTEPATVEKARVWYPKAQSIQKLSKDIYTYIEGVRADLKKEAGLKTSDGVESFKESNKIAVMRLFEKKKKGEELFEQLKNYKRDILAVDAELGKEFNTTMILTTPAFDAAKEKQDFTKTFFDDIPTVAALAMLGKFQNNIRIAENKTVTFCNNKVAFFIRSYDIYTAFAAASSSYVKAGEEIEITAAVGAFSTAAKPVIIINGKNIALDVDGASHYKFKASDKPGKHVVPVEITFNDQDGKKQTITKNIEYTVADQ